MIALTLTLFLIFAKIGFCSFGGLSMIPMVYEEMVLGGYITSAEFSDIVAIAEMTPGSFSVNMATFAGLRAGSLLCSIGATLGNIVPSLTLCLAAMIFIDKFRDNYWIKSIMSGVRPVCIGMLVGTAVLLFQENYVTSAGALSFKSLVIGVIVGYLLLKRKWSVVKSIGVAALLGVLLPAF